MGPWEDRVYEEGAVFVRHRASQTARAGLIENYFAARELDPTSWIGPFGTYERARDFLTPANSIYRKPSEAGLHGENHASAKTGAPLGSRGPFGAETGARAPGKEGI